MFSFSLSLSLSFSSIYLKNCLHIFLPLILFYIKCINLNWMLLLSERCKMTLYVANPLQ
jgi:hypothetical protein